jgi:hypothetical protein
MARALVIGGLAAAFVAAGCAPPPPPRPAGTSADLGAWLDAHEAGPPARSASISRPVGIAATGPVTLREPPPPPVRPRRRGRVDVSFQKADMANAFQFLADAGRFNVVMEDGLSGTVSATMRGVDPYDALLALAEANGVEVHDDGQIVVLTRKKK